MGGDPQNLTQPTRAKSDAMRSSARVHPMQSCPRCGAAGVTTRAKARSSAGWPAVCSLCGGLSYVKTSAIVEWIGSLLATVLAPFCLIVLFAAPLTTFGVSVVALLALSFVSDWHRARARLRPIDPGRSRRSRRWFYLLLTVFVLLLIGGVVSAFREQHQSKKPLSSEILRRLEELRRRLRAPEPTSAWVNPAFASDDQHQSSPFACLRAQKSRAARVFSSTFPCSPGMSASQW